MGGEGHIADMISRMKYNLSAKKAHKEQHQKLNEVYRKNNRSIDTNPIKEIQISKENLEKIKENIKRTSTRERKLGILITTIITVVIALSIFYYAYLRFFK